MIRRLRTKTPAYKRAARWLWEACETCPWLPLAIALVAVTVINSIN